MRTAVAIDWRVPLGTLKEFNAKLLLRRSTADYQFISNTFRFKTISEFKTVEINNEVFQLNDLYATARSQSPPVGSRIKLTEEQVS